MAFAHHHQAGGYLVERQRDAGHGSTNRIVALCAPKEIVICGGGKAWGLGPCPLGTVMDSSASGRTILP
jgi:hypothetical protein